MGKASRKKRDRREGKVQPKQEPAPRCPECDHLPGEHRHVRKKQEVGPDRIVLRCTRTQVRLDHEATEEKGEVVRAFYHCPCETDLGEAKR